MIFQDFFRYVVLPLGLVLVGGVGCSNDHPAPQFNRNVEVTRQIENLASADRQTRIDAVVALGEAGPYAAEAVPVLVEALEDQDPLVRRLAAYALGRMGDTAKEAIPALLEALDRATDEPMIAECVNSIQAIDPEAARDLDVPTHF